MDRAVATAWERALSGLRVRHPDTAARPWFRIDGGYLHVGVHGVHDTRTAATRDLPVASVRLDHFPGDDLARKWFAAAWAGYLQHEALELVTFEDGWPLDPHEEPYESNPVNRGLRDGFPPVLTANALERALRVVMEPADARALIERN